MPRAKYDALMQMEFGNWKLKLEMELRSRLRKKEERLELERMGQGAKVNMEDIDESTRRRLITAYAAKVKMTDLQSRFKLGRNANVLPPMPRSLPR